VDRSAICPDTGKRSVCDGLTSPAAKAVQPGGSDESIRVSDLPAELQASVDFPAGAALLPAHEKTEHGQSGDRPLGLEGVWAASRGFLVAGARRMVTSDGLVDDKAVASLIRVV